MNIHLVSDGCGYVGRNLVKRLLHTTTDTVFVIDDLSTGTAPETWLDNASYTEQDDLRIYNGGVAKKLK